jgi:uncharacterized glyoxalase superfamily protein PhnB
MAEQVGATTQNVFPSLRYRDAKAAIAWLKDAFGFEEVQVIEGDDGTIHHAELRLGPGMVMLGTERPDDQRFGSHAGQSWIYAAIDDPDSLFERASAAGAKVVMELTDTDYGSRDFSVRDPEDNLWSFGTYRPSVGG